MERKTDVLIVGGGAVGVCCAYWLASSGRSVILIDQAEIPNPSAASGAHMQALRLTFGSDLFLSELALKASALWLELNASSGEKLFVQNGFLDVARGKSPFGDASLRILKDLGHPASKLGKEDFRRQYPVFNPRSLSGGVFHPSGGILWASRAVSAFATMAQRQGLRLLPRTKAAAVLRDGNSIAGVRDERGRVLKADQYVFACGAGTRALLGDKLPVKVTRHWQMYLRPPQNSGRYRVDHFPVVAFPNGFYVFPMHIHGYLKISDHGRGEPVKSRKDEASGPSSTEPPASFERKCRAFLKDFLPGLAGFSEFEGSCGLRERTQDGDFIVDRLNGASNAFLAAGLSDDGFALAPVLGQALADLACGAKSRVNLHRFRLGRFKGFR